MAPLEPLAAATALPSHRSERPYEDKTRPAFAILAAISFSHLLNDYRLKGGSLLARLKVAAAFIAAVVHRRRTAPR